MHQIQQGWALVPVALASSWRSRGASFTIITCILLVVVVIAVFLSMASGFAATTRDSGSGGVAVVTGGQSTSEASSQLSREQIEILSDIPRIARRPVLFSPELMITVGGTNDQSGQRINMPLRGMDEAGRRLRHGFRITKGRLYGSGSREVVVGRRLYRDTGSPPLGSSVVLGGREWKVVGVFALDSPVFEAEYWTDLTSLQMAYKRENEYQTVRIGLWGGKAIDQLQSFVDRDPRLSVQLQTEQQLYASQSQNTVRLINYVGWPVASILAAGCTAGILNAMFIVMHSRRRWIRTLRIVGFEAGPIVASIVVESWVLATVGAFVGLLIVYVCFEGTEARLLGNGFTTVEYNMHLTIVDGLRCLAVALGIGTLGSFIPACRSVRL